MSVDVEPSSTPQAGTLVRSNLVVAAGTALSRITGFARFAVFGIIFGRAALWDAFNTANNTPNIIYELALGGIVAATLVPVFTRQFADHDDEATSAVISTCMLAVGVITLIAVGIAPLIFRLSSVNVSSNVDADDYRWLGTQFAYIFLVQILFYGLFAMWAAALNAKRHFFAAAWTPILANLVIVASLLLANAQLGDDEDGFIEALTSPAFRTTLAVGATIGIAVQALSLYPALGARGHPAALPSSVAAPCRSDRLPVVGLDVRLRAVQRHRRPDRDQPRGTREWRCQRLRARLRVLPAPPHAAGRVHHHHVRTRSRRSGEASRPHGLRQPHVARHPADRVGDDSRRVRFVRVASADRRRAAAARRVRCR